VGTPGRILSYLKQSQNK
jgi:ATP-dependent RNA helicase DeaD